MIEDFHPRKTKILIGHNKQLKIIKTSITKNKLHHSWILEGPNGVGKATFSYEIAKTLLSLNQVSSTINRQIYNNTHPDLKI